MVNRAIINTRLFCFVNKLYLLLKGEIQSLGRKRCKNLDETAELTRTIERKEKEFRKKVAKSADEDGLLAQVLWQAMDESRLDLAENGNTPKKWKDLKKFVEARHIRQKSRQKVETAKGKLNSRGWLGR